MGGLKRSGHVLVARKWLRDYPSGCPLRPPTVCRQPRPPTGTEMILRRACYHSFRAHPHTWLSHSIPPALENTLPPLFRRMAHCGCTISLGRRQGVESARRVCPLQLLHYTLNIRFD